MLCHRCETDKPETDFRQVKPYYAARGRNLWCRPCCAGYQRTRRQERKTLDPSGLRAETRRHRIKYSYGLTESAYDALLESQHGQCAICKSSSALVVDHNHTDGVVRGLLCGTCNTGIGMLKEDPDIFAAALLYLQGVK